MAYPVASTQFLGSVPSPAYTGTFIPEIWSGKLIEKFYSSTVLSAISNTDYEGEIKNQGDKVIIRTKPTVTIRNYEAGQALTVDRPSSNVVNLLIDKGKYFNLALDDVMDIQADINLMDIWSADAGEQLKIVIDTEVLLALVGLQHAKNRGLTAGNISSTINLGVTGTPVNLAARSPGVGEVEITDMLVRLGQALDEQNIPETGRWVVLPAWAAAYIKQSDFRQAQFSGDSSNQLFRNGRLGMVDRFTLYTSNLLPSGTAGGLAAGEWVIYAGHPHAFTFASQINKVETLRSEQSFSNLLRGLQVYGYKVLDSTAIAQAVVIP